MLKKVVIILLALLIGAYSYFQRETIVHLLSPGFRFEKYETKEQAEAVLLQMHPVGSSVDDLLKTLKDAGATVTTYNYTKWSTRAEGEVGEYSYTLSKNGCIGLDSYQWAGPVGYDVNRKIIYFGVNKMHDGL